MHIILVCFVSVFSLFVSGSLYISHMARWLHPCIHSWCCTEHLLNFFIFIEPQPHMPIAYMPVIIFIESWTYFFQDRHCLINAGPALLSLDFYFSLIKDGIILANMRLILVPHKGINSGGSKFDLHLSHVYTWYRILTLVPRVHVVQGTYTCPTCTRGTGYLHLSHVLHMVYF